MAVAKTSVATPPLNSCAPDFDKAKNSHSSDVLILGGTPSGVAAAITAKDAGLKVILLSQDRVVGGAISNGLDATDIGNDLAVSGYPRYFFGLVSKFYKSRLSWRLEPKVAESMFSAELSKHGIIVKRNVSIKTVVIQSNQIESLTTKDGQRYCARTFVDATYTGDLLALSGIRTHVSDSDLMSYNEPAANHPSMSLVAAFQGVNRAEVSRAFAKNPYIRSYPELPKPEVIYKHGMPSMTYRVCVTKVKSNRVAFTKGPHYAVWSPSWKLFMRFYFGKQNPAFMTVEDNGTILTALWQIARLPNNKYDLNSGRSSFTNVPVPMDYYTQPSHRNKINAEYAEYLQDFLHFVQNDPNVPIAEKHALHGFGLCADEFVDNHNWPYSPYVRAGQRVVGQKTLTAGDIFNNRLKGDSVAIGSYRLDMKPGLFVYSQGKLFQDWAVFFKAPVYEIPFGAMLPRKGVTNLITSVSLSASPLAYSSMRMEVQFMALGEVAGFAAAEAIRENSPFRDGMYRPVQIELRKVGAIYKIEEICKMMTHKERVVEHFHPPTCKAHGVY